jgi:uncharacterized protein YndB with AHSA1/START domain
MSNYASATGATLRIERRLPGPIERVWAYVVEPEKRALWFVGGIWDQHAGGEARSLWDHTRLSHEPTPEAWKSFDGMETTATITRIEPPRLLSYRTDMGAGAVDITFELVPDGDDVIELRERLARLHRYPRGPSPGREAARILDQLRPAAGRVRDPLLISGASAPRSAP